MGVTVFNPALAVLIAGTTSASGPNVSFADGGGVSFGANGNTITASVVAQSVQTQSNVQGISAGTQVGRTGDIIFSNSNGIAFGMSGSNTITASYTVPTVTNSSATISAGTQSGTLSSLVFSNSNGLAFGLDAGTITGSYTVPSTAGLISAINVSAGGASNNGSAFVFSNSNNISFGLNGSTVTATVTVPAQTVQTQSLIAGVYDGANSISTGTIRFTNANGVSFSINGQTISGSVAAQSVQTQSLVAGVYDGANSISTGTIRFTNANGVSFSINGQTISGSVAAQSNQTEGLYALGNTTGQSSSSTFDARTLSISGAGNVSVGYSGNALVISGAGGAGGGLSAIYDGANSISTGTIRFTNANGVSFSINGQTLSGSVAAQSVQTQSLIAGIYDGANSISTGTIRFTNANGVSFSINGQTISGSVAAQTNQTLGGYALGNTAGESSSSTMDARSLSFSGLGIVSVGYSGGAVVISAPSGGAQSAQTVGLYALGNTTQNSSTTLDARTISFNGLGAATVGYSNGSVQISVPTQTAQTQSNIAGVYDGANSISTGTIRFTNANGVSFSINGQTISGSVAAQSNQTAGWYGLGNTTQNSSTTLDARTFSLNGLGGITVGYSNGSIQISGPQTVAQSNQTAGWYALGNTTQNSSTTLDARTFSLNGLGAATVGYSNGSIQISVPTQTAQTQSNIAGIYDGANSISTGTIRFTNANGVSFSINGQTISGSVAAQTNQTIGFYGLGNTTQNSSTTLDARTVSFNGLGDITVGFSNGSVQISGSQTVQTQSIIRAIYDGANSITTGTIRFTNANGVTFSVNGQTLSASIAPRKLSQLAWPEVPWQTNFSISNASFSLQHFQPRADITASRANFLMALSGNSNSTGALTVSMGIYTWAGSTLSLASSDSRQISWTSGSSTTNSAAYGGISGTCYRTLSLANWAITAGDYMLGIWYRTTNDGTWRAFGVQGPTIVNGADANETNHYLNGYSTSSYSTAMVASIDVTNTNYVRTGVPAFQQPSVIFLGSY